MKDVKVEQSYTHDDTTDVDDYRTMAIRGRSAKDRYIMSRTNISRCGPAGEGIGEGARTDQPGNCHYDII